MEELALGLDGVTTLFGKIHKVQNSGSQVGKSGDTLHFDGVHLLQRVVENTGSVDHLPSKVLVVHVSDEQRFGCERIWLNIDVRSSDLVDE